MTSLFGAFLSFLRASASSWSFIHLISNSLTTTTCDEPTIEKTTIRYMMSMRSTTTCSLDNEKKEMLRKILLEIPIHFRRLKCWLGLKSLTILVFSSFAFFLFFPNFYPPSHTHYTEPNASSGQRQKLLNSPATLSIIFMIILY